MEDKAAPKKELLVDTDWITTVLCVVVLLALVWLTGLEVRHFVNGAFAFAPTSASWQHYFLAANLALLLFTFRERKMRVLLGLLLFSLGVQTALWWLVGKETQRAVAPGLLLLRLGIWLVGIVWLLQWLRARVRVA
jgi:hypothetical protein